MTSVTAVIPVFNRPRAAARAVASALAQTRAPDEILLVDDCSQPPLTLADLGTGDPRVRILRLDANRGAAGARQAGVDAARGEVVAFLDSDDVWLPGKLAAQLPLLEGAEALTAVACGWDTVPEISGAPERRIPLASADPLDFASGCWFSPGSTVLVPRAAFARVGPLDPALRRLEDLDWFLRFALAGGRLLVAPMAGAVISTGRRGKRGPVEDAARRIRTRIAALGDPAVTPARLRRLEAYLDLERAAAARNEGARAAMLFLMARSFARAPRLQVPLRRWWRGDA